MNRKIYITRKDLDEMFDSAQPYQVTGKRQQKTDCEFYSAVEAAQKYGRTKSAIHKLAARHKVPKRVSADGAYLYRRSDIVELLAVIFPTKRYPSGTRRRRL